MMKERLEETCRSEKHGDKWQKQETSTPDNIEGLRRFCRRQKTDSEPTVRKCVFTRCTWVESDAPFHWDYSLPQQEGKKKKMLLKHEATTSDRPLTSPLHDTRDQLRQQQFKLHHWNHKYRHPSCQNQDSMLVEILEKAVLLSSIKYQYDLLVEGKWVHLFSCWKVSANASVSACFRLFSLASPFKH